MKTIQNPPQWAQQPNESDPGYVAFALYCSLGPNRDRIIGADFGGRLWELLMAATAGIPEDTPIHLVCSQISALLKILISEDLGDRLDPNDNAEALLIRFHARLQRDEQLLSALQQMLDNLARLQRGQALRPLPVQSAAEIVNDAENFLARQRNELP